MISSGTEAPRLNPVNLGTLPEKNEMIRMLSIAADLFMGTFAAVLGVTLAFEAIGSASLTCKRVCSYLLVGSLCVLSKTTTRCRNQSNASCTMCLFHLRTVLETRPTDSVANVLSY